MKLTSKQEIKLNMFLLKLKTCGCDLRHTKEWMEETIETKEITLELSLLLDKSQTVYNFDSYRKMYEKAISNGDL